MSTAAMLAEPAATSAPPPAITLAHVQAGDAVRAGNLQKAELLCRELLARRADDALALTLLGHVALKVGRFDHAEQCYARAEALSPPADPAVPAAPWRRMAAEGTRLRLVEAARSAPARHLLIKAWGYGFWSDMDHVLGQLLLAHMTGRIPVVHWGTNSLFGAPAVDNAFELYFEPVSPVTLADLADAAGRKGAARSFYPPKWHAGNLRHENVDKFSGAGSRLSGLYMLERGEDVLVSDFHTKLNDLIPWIEPSSEFFGLGREQIYRTLYRRHVRLRAGLQQRIDACWAARLQGRRWLAVHARGSDKVREQRDLDAVNAAYFERIDGVLQARPDTSLFLLTDSDTLLAQFRRRYGDRVEATPSIRTTTDTGVHYAGHDGATLGEQVVTDVCLAARCDQFLGNGASNVSVAVRHLRDWPAGSFELIGPDMLGQRNLFLHDW